MTIKYCVNCKHFTTDLHENPCKDCLAETHEFPLGRERPAYEKGIPFDLERAEKQFQSGTYIINQEEDTSCQEAEKQYNFLSGQ